MTDYKAWVDSQGYRIKGFGCNNGRGEFNNKDILHLLGDNGISFDPSPRSLQDKNVVYECMIRTLNTKARCLLLDASLPVCFWAEAIKTIFYIHRPMPTSILPNDKSPHEMLYADRPQIYHLHRFGFTINLYIRKGDDISSQADLNPV